MGTVGLLVDAEDPTKFYCRHTDRICPGRNCVNAQIHTAPADFRNEFNVEFWYTCKIMAKVGRFDGNGGRYDV